jgi:hypothetical protein
VTLRCIETFLTRWHNLVTVPSHGMLAPHMKPATFRLRKHTLIIRSIVYIRFVRKLPITMLQQPLVSSSSTRLQARCSARCLALNSPPAHLPHRIHTLAQHDAPSALTACPSATLAGAAAGSRQQQRCRVATAAAKKQAARRPAGKGFGNPNKLASKATSNASRKCPCGSGQLYPVSARSLMQLAGAAS